MKSMIIEGNIGSVRNELVRFIEGVSKIHTVNQSLSAGGGHLVLTIIYEEKEGYKAPINETTDQYIMGEH